MSKLRPAGTSVEGMHLLALILAAMFIEEIDCIMTHTHCYMDCCLFWHQVGQTKKAKRAANTRCCEEVGRGAVCVVTRIECAGFCSVEIPPARSRKVTFQLVWPKRPESEFRVHASRNESWLSLISTHWWCVVFGDGRKNVKSDQHDLNRVDLSALARGGQVQRPLSMMSSAFLTFISYTEEPSYRILLLLIELGSWQQTRNSGQWTQFSKSSSHPYCKIFQNFNWSCTWELNGVPNMTARIIPTISVFVCWGLYF